MEWRMAAMSVGTTIQVLTYCLWLVEFWSDLSSIHIILLRWIDAFIVTLIIEVFGAVGAVWGLVKLWQWGIPRLTKSGDQFPLRSDWFFLCVELFI
jgi:hypothetical protein